MPDKLLRRRTPANRRANSNDPATPRSSRSPAFQRKRIKPTSNARKPSKNVNILRRTKSEPSLLRGVGEDDGILCRPETWSDIFTSPEIPTPQFPRKCYQKDAKVVVNVSVEGSSGPIQTLVKLGSSVEETINLVITKYNQQGRTPPLDTSTCQLHQSYFSLHSLSKSDLIGDIGCRSFYLRKHNYINNEGDTVSNSSYQIDVKLDSSGEESGSSSTSFFFYQDIKKIILRSRKFCDLLGCIPCIG